MKFGNAGATVLGLVVLAASAASAPAGEKGKPKQRGCEVEADGALSSKITVGLEAELEDGELEGKLHLHDKQAKVNFHATAITSLVVSGDVASIQGLGKSSSASSLRFSATLDASRRSLGFRLAGGYRAEGVLAGKKDEVELEGSCPFDGRATVLLDDARRVSATFDRAGGRLAAGNVTLTIPAGALSEDETITMTPITDLADSPLSLSLIGGVKLEPEGLRFLTPAILTMPLPGGTPAASVIGFGSAGDGSDVHLAPHTIAGGAISLELWHFSTGGAASGGGAAVQTYTPSTAEQQAQQRIAAAGAACAAEQAAGTLGGPACANLQQQIEGTLTDWYGNTVRPGLQQAVGAQPSQIVAALAEWHHWQRQVEELLNDLQGPCGSLQSQCNEAHDLATNAVADLARRRLNECTGTNLGAQLAAVALVADFMVAAGITALPSDVPPDLMRACAHLEIEVVEFPAVAALTHANTLRGRVSVDVHNGPDRTDVAHTLTVDGSQLGTSADGAFQTTLTPTTAPLNVTLEAQANAVSLQNASFGGQTLLVRQARDRIELEALNPTTIEPGEIVTLRARVAGDGMDGATVTYANEGIGSLGASSGTTNADGEAPVFVYNAPADTGGDATVTATFGDASDSVAIDVEAPIEVAISPASATVPTAGTSQFTATVTGTSNSAVTWTATGGTITQSGLYTAGSAAGSFTVTASSDADPSKSASATVTVASASLALNGRHSGVGGTFIDGVIQGHQPGGRIEFVYVRSGNALTIGYYRCNRQVGQPTQYGCSLEIVYAAVLDGLAFSGSGRYSTHPGNPAGEPAGSITGEFSADGRTITGDFRFLGCEAGQDCELDFVADRIGSKFFPEPIESRIQYGGGRLETWRYADFEIEGQITDLSAPDPINQPDRLTITVTDPAGRSLSCRVPQPWFPSYISQFLEGQGVIMYCEVRLHAGQQVPLRQAIHLFRFP